jgi:hypothetical protein
MYSPNMATIAAEDTRRRRQDKAIVEHTSAGVTPQGKLVAALSKKNQREGRSSNPKSDLERSRIHHSMYLILKASLAQLKDWMKQDSCTEGGRGRSICKTFKSANT